MRLDLPSILTMEVLEPQWIVEGMIPAGTVVLVAGDAGIGKSVMNLAEGLHIALGRPFLGHGTRQTRVLYFDEENSKPDVSAYLQQLWIGLGQPDPALVAEWFQIEHYSLGTAKWKERMTMMAQEFRPGIIYVDTATSALAVDEENDNAEAQRVVQGLRHVMRDTGTNPAMKILKHAKYQSGGGHGDARRTIRGAKAWLGAVDQTMYHIASSAGRPRKDGLRMTILVPDKSRAYGLKQCIRVIPSFTETTPKGLILTGELFTPEKDLLVVPA